MPPNLPVYNATTLFANLLRRDATRSKLFMKSFSISKTFNQPPQPSKINKSHIHTINKMSLEPELKKTKVNDTLKVYKRSENAKTPTKGSALAAGYDIYSSEESSVPAHGQALVATDISIIVPVGTYGRVAPRSGLAVKHGISTGAGVIDADYRGEVKVVLFNHSDKDFKIEKGERIAQLVLEKIVNAEIQEISAEELDTTERGAGGFGSTGTK